MATLWTFSFVSGLRKNYTDGRTLAQARVLVASVNTDDKLIFDQDQCVLLRNVETIEILDADTTAG